MAARWGRLVLIDNDGRFVDELSRRIAPVVEELATTSCATGPFEIPPKRDADVVVLNTGLLGPGAIELVRQIRAVDHSVVLIARVEVPNAVDAILLFDAGVDDCVGAGDDLTFVEARLRRALQRRRACERRTSTSGVLELDPHANLAEEVGMTRVEERIWNVLRLASGEVVSISRLMQCVWRRSDVDPKLLYEHVSKLRRKLSPDDWHIKNFRGQGYRLASRFETSIGETPRSATEHPYKDDLGVQSLGYGEDCSGKIARK